MILYPAIDLKDGRCVRLVHGAMESATVFYEEPADAARAFAAAGAEWLHVVDLNGAFAGEPVNAAAVRGIIAAAPGPVQLGGGVRDMATIAYWLDAGVSRVILGTAAVRDADLVRAACARWPGQVAVGVDARGGKVAVAGWAETTEMAPLQLARSFEDAGVAAIIYTDIDRDGALGGPNIAATAALANAVSIPVIASGGVGSIKDIRDLSACDAPLDGVIVGRALYDGRVSIADAMAVLSERARC